MEPSVPQFSPRLEKVISTETHRVLRKFTFRALVAFIIVVAAASISLGRIESSSIRRVHDGLVNSCHRVNVLRAQSNLSDMVSFRVLSISAIREYELARTDKKATRPTHLQSANLLSGEAKNLTITELTNCRVAIAHPATYKFPRAHPVGNPKTGKFNSLTRVVRAQSLRALDDATFVP